MAQAKTLTQMELDRVFEYIDTKTGEKIKIKPKKFNILFMNNKLQHRVLPVKTGTRYSLISFMKYKDKELKSIL